MSAEFEDFVYDIVMTGADWDKQPRRKTKMPGDEHKVNEREEEYSFDESSEIAD